MCTLQSQNHPGELLAGCGTQNLSRRKFLSAFAVLSAGTALSARLLPAQIDKDPRRIDVHHHFTPKVFTDFLQSQNRAGGFGNWTLEADLADMDNSGTQMAILSITTPGFGQGPAGEIRQAVRGCNEAAAKLKADHRGRFGSFAALPLTDVEGFLKEIEYALDTLKAEGIGLFSNYGDKWLGHASFGPIYEELNRRRAVVYVHPIAGNCCTNLLPNVPNEGAMIEFGTDTTRSIADLIFSGTTTKYPNMVWIFSHAGGSMPFLIASNPVALDALRKVVPVSQIVYGTDYWYRTSEETARGLTTSRVFTATELRAIDRENAAQVLSNKRYETGRSRTLVPR